MSKNLLNGMSALSCALGASILSISIVVFGAPKKLWFGVTLCVVFGVWNFFIWYGARKAKQ